MDILLLIICLVLGFSLWLVVEKIIFYIENKNNNNNSNNKEKKIILPQGLNFFTWFFNYLLNYYNLKPTSSIVNNKKSDGEINELKEDTSENTVLKWFNVFNTSTYCVSFFGRPMIFTKDINIARYILSNVTDYQKPPDSSGVLIRLASNSILMSEGKEWKHHRDILEQPFSSRNVKLMVPTIESTVEQLINQINLGNKQVNSGDEFRIDIHSTMTKLTFDIIGKLSIGYDFKSINNSNNKESENVSKQFDFILNEMIRPIRRFSKYLPLFNDIKLFRYLANFETVTKNAIKSRLSVISNPDGEISGNSSTYKTNYLLDPLIKSNINEKEIIGNINTFLLAGHETSANLLTFIFYLLSTHENIQDQLYKELKQMSSENIEKCEFLDFVIYETLRLFPPAPMIGRNSTKEVDELHGQLKQLFRIPKDTLILFSVYAINRDPLVFENPNQFIPSRWATMEDRFIFQHISFSMGKRVCIGMNFSLVEARIIISKLLLNYRIEYKPIKNLDKPFTIYQRATLTTKYPINLNFIKR
ncbi:hypothetical protein DICPUDRAFT_28572 [Dictyostelium purpureum]|uniref:Cytochrome P450 n=1 Tax=Dictyostelium purpureum TaxID=5786 RepID=F0ZC86_DICPU|nr:uncharacterized protein DICPUDRAFT_28572 [Dictyostelium purpureum]EGC38455.1 hypothetical protein DICPUDRAFT_28572 [Dictyostelium purpureum]|eukprot:XP_003285013.1 hypothetical protein DICPUDRAFT_28572 [Dictyostelium purpureum]